MHVYQDLVVAGGAITVVCVATFFLLRLRRPSSSRTWQGVTVVAAVIGASAAVYGFLNG